MGKKHLNRAFAAAGLGVLLSIGTVYAASNAYDQVMVWTGIKSADAQAQVESKIRSLVGNQLEKLNVSTNLKLAETDKQLLEISRLETLDTTGTIKKALNEETERLQQSEKEISDHSREDFEGVVSRANSAAEERLKTIETDYQDELGKLSYTQLGNPGLLDGETALNLSEEISETKASISQLQSIQSSEPNQAVKDFIQKKIDFLNQLILIMDEEKS